MLVASAVAIALLLGPWLAHAGVRGAARYRGAVPSGDAAPTPPRRPSPVRVVVVTLVLGALLPAAAGLAGPRPALVALCWAAGAAVVLAQIDLAVHRLPDRVVYPAAAVVTAGYLADALLLGTWDDVVRAALAGVLVFAGGSVAAAVSPQGLGFGDVKLLGLLGLLLGWFGWSVVAAGLLLGLAAGAVVALALVAARRAGWRTAVALGPSLLSGAALALVLAGSGAVG